MKYSLDIVDKEADMKKVLINFKLDQVNNEERRTSSALLTSFWCLYIIF